MRTKSRPILPKSPGFASFLFLAPILDYFYLYGRADMQPRSLNGMNGQAIVDGGRCASEHHPRPASDATSKWGTKKKPRKKLYRFHRRMHYKCGKSGGGTPHAKKPGQDGRDRG